MARGRIFINYRRDDSRADSGRLYDRLAARFPGKVFRDVASLEPGVEWHEAIARVLGQADVCIVVIGKDWVTITDANGRRRLDDPRDTVRQEVATALQRQMRVFPVLVGGAQMPAEEDIPPELQGLCRRNALHITEQDWDEDYAKLLRAIEVSLGMRPSQPNGGRTSSRTKWLWAGTGALAALIVLAVYGTNHAQPGPVTNIPVPGGGSATPAGGSATPGGGSTPVADSTGASAGPTDSGRVPQYKPVISPEPRRPVLTAANFVGNWDALVSAGGQQAEEEVEIYSDSSFRVLLSGALAAVGRWRYNPGTGSLEVPDGANFLENGVKFTCAWNGTSGDRFSGGCVDRLRNSWTVSLSRGEGTPDEIYDVPRVNLSGLTLAERAAFVQVLTAMRCTCPCGLNVHVCLQKDQTCPFSPTLASNALANFLRITRS